MTELRLPEATEAARLRYGTVRNMMQAAADAQPLGADAQPVDIQQWEVLSPRVRQQWIEHELTRLA